MLLLEKGLAGKDPFWQHFIILGFLGAMTTFSAFSLETLALFESGRPLAAVLYIFASIFLCLTGAFLGILLARLLA